ncbi:hypothetical protein J132_07587 [Termitomyces sp. J132]|nr:hypothetical protein J132_07587 [Termitomyces sp. J132]
MTYEQPLPSMTSGPSMNFQHSSMISEQPPMTSDERYRTTYNEQPPTSTRRHHDAQFFAALPTAPISPLSLPGTSETLPTIGRLDAPGALGIILNGEHQHDQGERHNLYRTISVPPVTPTPGNSSASRLSLSETSGSLLHCLFGRLDAPGALGISMHQYVQEDSNISGTIPLPTVTSTPVNSPVSNNQADSAPMVPPQANHLGPEESSPVAGNSTSLLFGPPAQGITYEIPQCLYPLKNLKIENPISVRKLLSILTYCSHLEMLSVMINEDDITHAVDFSGQVAAGNLISLSIVTSVESKLLLDRFMARNLRIFHLEWNSQGSRIPIPNSADIGIDLFVKQSGCRLNTLSLVNLYPDEVQLVNCLKLDASAYLQTLVIRNSSFSGILSSSSGRVVTDMTLQTLSQSNGGAPLCPRLSRLEITSCHASDGILVSMVRARNVEEEQTFSLHYSFGAQGEGQSLHPIDRLGLAELARKYNFTITEGSQLCIPL